MKRCKAAILSIISATVLTPSIGFAGAFQLYELGTPIIGRAGVGQAVIDDEASCAYFNPAAMAFLPGTEIMLGSQIMLPQIEFSPHPSTTISGDAGGNAGSILPGMNLFHVYHYSPCLQFGLSVTTPYGGAMNYNDGYIGRYFIQNAFFYAINVNPSMSYRINNCFSVGGGVSVEYMNLTQTTAIPILNAIDGQINLKVDDVAAGFNLGVMFTPYQSTKIGLTYRSEIKHDLRGDITFLRINPTPDVLTEMIVPQNVIASISQGFANNMSVLAEFGWANWSSMKNTILDIRNVSTVIPRNWKDTYRLGLATQYKVAENLTLQAGLSYDTSPTSTNLRLPDLPMDKQIRLGTGVLYSIIKPVMLAFSYEYLHLGKAEINSTTTQGVLSGDYARNHAHILQVSINVCA